MLLTILQGPAWPPGQTVIQPQMSAVPWRSAAPGHHGRQAASLKESLTRGSPRPGQAEGPALPHCLRLGLFTFSLGLLTAPGVPRHAQLVRAQSKTFLLVGRGKEGKPMLFGRAPPEALTRETVLQLSPLWHLLSPRACTAGDYYNVSKD